MKRLIAVLMALTLAGLGGSAAWAQMVDLKEMGVNEGSPGALEGPFRADSANGVFAFLAVASPRNCNDGSNATDCPNEVRAWFYDAACTRVSTVAIPLSENDTELVGIHAVTTATSGSVLVGHADPAAPNDVLLDFAPPTPHQIAGVIFEIDVAIGIARTIQMARIGNDFSNGWAPYYPVGVIPFLPADDGSNFFSLVQLRCPVGSALVDPTANDLLVGTAQTLGGDMLDLASQDEGGTPGDAYASGTTAVDGEALCDDCSPSPSNFATDVTIRIFDTDEVLLDTVSSFACSCLTEVRASAISSFAASNSTYWELEGNAPANFSGSTDGVFAGAFSILIVNPLVPRVLLYDRVNIGRDKAVLVP
jgi:hypothetical protein